MPAQDGPGRARSRTVDFDDLDSSLEEAGRRSRVVSFDDLDDGGAEGGARPQVVSFDDLESGSAADGAESHPVSFADPDSGPAEDRGESGAVSFDDTRSGPRGESPAAMQGTGPNAGPVETAEPRARRADRTPTDTATGDGRRDSRARRGSRDGRGPAENAPQDDEARAKEICLRLLTDRARTVKELADALRRKEIPEDVATRVLERFDEVGLVDDEAFAGQWVRARHHHKGLGRRAIAAELHRKGVAKEIADTALTEIDTESEEARARELVDRKLRSMRVDTKEHRASAARRLVGMLARKGYGSGVAYGTVREAIAARGAEDDELGDGPADA